MAVLVGGFKHDDEMSNLAFYVSIANGWRARKLICETNQFEMSRMYYEGM